MLSIWEQTNFSVCLWFIEKIFLVWSNFIEIASLHVLFVDSIDIINNIFSFTQYKENIFSILNEKFDLIEKIMEEFKQTNKSWLTSPLD